MENLKSKAEAINQAAEKLAELFWMQIFYKGRLNKANIRKKPNKLVADKKEPI